jgi:hypothetical protein
LCGKPQINHLGQWQGVHGLDFLIKQWVNLSQLLKLLKELVAFAKGLINVLLLGTRIPIFIMRMSPITET